MARYKQSHLVDVDGIRLFPLALPLLLVALGHSLGSFATLSSSLTRSLRWHVELSWRVGDVCRCECGVRL